jgi:WbqC-like protein family
MRLAIMQPYFLPYIGYFQLMSAVDKLLLLDDVTFINGGWINRNRIAVNGAPHWLTLPLAQASQNRLISEIAIVDDASWKRKTLRTVELNYGSAPFAPHILPLFSDLLKEAQGSLTTFLSHQLRRLADYIGIPIQIEQTSARYPKDSVTGPGRILDICVREGASTYVNLPGGRSLYDAEGFAAAGIELLFLDPNFSGFTLRYSGEEGPCLSILDLLMFNPVTAIREATEMFRLNRT